MNHIQICFYRPGDKFGCFANFSKHTVFYNNVLFKTSEHAFQAMKFYPNNLDIFEQVKNATTPKEAAIMGRSLSPIRADWESEITSDISCITLVKDKIMYDVVLAKFSQHENIKQDLLSTDNAELVEDSPIDYYWGWGKDHSGKNKLGQILMEVRLKLNQSS